MNPFSELPASLTPILVTLYTGAVLVTAIVGIINLVVLHKHAERPSVARGIATIFSVIFILICILSGITILQYFSNANA